MTGYHGTSVASAYAIVGPPLNVNVTLGCGELGKGFYLGKSPHMASSLAHARFGPLGGAVIRFVIDDKTYATLDEWEINDYRELSQIDRKLRKKGTICTATFRADVIKAPIISNAHATQFKFETVNAQAVLNASTATIV